MTSAKELRIEALREWRKHGPHSPCVDQTDEDIAAYYCNAPIGAPAAVRMTQGGLLQYRITEIEGQDPARGRVHVRGFGAFYQKHGRNCFHPKGQTTLVVPTEAVLNWAAEHPEGKFGVSRYRDAKYQPEDP